MANTVEQATQTQITNIEKSTGKSFDAWLAIARKHGGKHGEIVKFLKEEHGLTHGNANLIAIMARKMDEPAPAPDADPAAVWFTGKKADMRPTYDKLIQTITKFGSDIELAPKKTYMSLRRSKQFACLTPTASRVDVGINLKGAKPTKRLLAEKPGGMFTHRVPVATPQEVDKELIAWLKTAYDNS